MIYRVFKSSMPTVQIAEIQDPNYPLINKGDKIPLTIDDKDSLFKVSKIGGFNMDKNKLVIDIWVDDFFP